MIFLKGGVEDIKQLLAYPIRQLIIAPAESLMSEIMNAKLISISPGTHRSYI
jgi:hypothetical protein